MQSDNDSQSARPESENPEVAGLSPEQARQGRPGRPVLAVLVLSILAALIVIAGIVAYTMTDEESAATATQIPPDAEPTTGENGANSPAAEQSGY